LGRNTETHNEQSTRYPTPGERSSCTYFQAKAKLHLSFALANRNAKAGVKPTPALIETTANPKRCGFSLSTKKSAGPDHDKLRKTSQNQSITHFS
jgi:hypothetical protein